MFRSSIRRRLNLAFIGLALIPLLVVGLVLVWRTFAVESQQAVTLQEEVAKRLSSQVSAFIHEREAELRVTTQVRGVGELSPADQQNLLAELLFYQDVFDELVLIDSTGQEVARVARVRVITQTDLRNRASDPLFTEPLRTRKTYYSPVQVEAQTGQLLMTIVLPIENLRTGSIDYVLTADLRLLFVQEVLRDVAGDQNVYLLNAEGRVIAHPNSSIVLRGTIFDLPTKSGLGEGLDGEQVVLAFSPIQAGEQTLYAVAETPASEALDLAFNTIYLIAGTILGALILAIVAGIWLVRRIVHPLQDLAGVATRIQEGDLAIRAEVTSQDEIGALAIAFNSMTDRLRLMVQNLEKRVADRTRDLQVAVDVSREITGFLSREELLNEVVKRIRNTFNLYAVHIFLLEGKTIRVGAQAGDHTDEEGIPVIHLDAVPSLIAQSARTKQIVMAGDVTQAEGYLSIASLPFTHSEMAIPILHGDILLGVLDLQSKELNHFTESDTRVMTVLAQQVAVAIENALLFEEQVKIAEELRTLDTLKSQFLAGMSHELRTPLNAIINFTQFVSTGTFGEVNERQVETLNKVVISGKHLLSLINDILDISKIEAGMLQLLIQEVDVNEVVETVKVTAQGLERSPNLELRFDIEPDLPRIHADKRRLRQILINLVSNAVKFTEEGHINFHARYADGVILFRIEDTGIGIREEDKAQIFEAFQQTADGLKKASGTGLGLPISKHLAEAHGGKLWVESEYDKGSTFYVTIPVGEKD